MYSQMKDKNGIGPSKVTFNAIAPIQTLCSKDSEDPKYDFPNPEGSLNLMCKTRYSLIVIP